MLSGLLDIEGSSSIAIRAAVLWRSVFLHVGRFMWCFFTQAENREMRSCLLTESVRCMLQCKNTCGRSAESERTLARRKCGTWKASDPQFATCWNEVRQGMKVLGNPLGHPSFVEAHLQGKCTKIPAHLFRTTLFATSPSPFASHLAHVLVWPSNRLVTQ